MFSGAISKPLYRRLVATWVLLSFLLLILFPAHYHLHHNAHDTTDAFPSVLAEQHVDHHVDLHVSLGHVDDAEHQLDNHVISKGNDVGTQVSAVKLLQWVAILTLVVLVVLQTKTIHQRWFLRDFGSPRTTLVLTPPLRAPPRG